MTPFHRFTDNIYATAVDSQITSSGNGTALNTNGAFGGCLLITTTQSSTPSLGMQLQVSANGTSGWTNFGSAVTITAVETKAMHLIDFQVQDMVQTLAEAQYVRIVYTISGTVAADAVGVLFGQPLVPPAQDKTTNWPGHTL